jgi:hypothetical protein
MRRKPTYTKLSQEKQIEIKQKFMEGHSLRSLALENDLLPQSLSSYSRKHGWNEERRLMRAELFQAFSDSKKAAFTGIYMDGTALLRKAVADALKEYEKVNDLNERLKIAKEISQVIKELDKIQRLDDGTPTEIKEERPFSIIELREKVSADPFFEEIEDAPYKPIPSDIANTDID